MIAGRGTAHTRAGIFGAVEGLVPLIDAAIAAAFAAGREILAVYGTDFTAEQKADKSPLTEADKRAHRAISSALAGTGLPVLSEEGRTIGPLERQPWQRFWLVDPLDGTKEFIKRNGEFTVNIALMERIGDGDQVIAQGNVEHPHPASPGGGGKMQDLGSTGATKHPHPASPGGGGEMSFDARYTVANARRYGELKEYARGMRKKPTYAEAILWRQLRYDRFGVRFRRQHIIEDHIVDFVCLRKRLVVEVDGEIHRFDREYDARRTARLQEFGFDVLRFSNEQVLKDLDHVIERIRSGLDSRPMFTDPMDHELEPGSSRDLSRIGTAHPSLPTGAGRGGVNDPLGTSTPIGAVLYVPVKDTLYFSWNGGGAYRIDSAGTHCTTSALKLAALAQRLPLPMSRDTYTIVASRSHSSPDTETFIKRMQEKHGRVDLVSMGSALKICLVAEGAADVYPRYAPTMEWDTAAGHAIANEAGKQLIDISTNEPMRYNKASLVNNWFIVQ